MKIGPFGLLAPGQGIFPKYIQGTYDEDGKEIVHAWFGGFYPADDPEYAIVVLAEGMESGGDYAAPVFKEICDGIAMRGKVG